LPYIIIITTTVIIELGLPSFSTVVHNNSVILSSCWQHSINPIVCHLQDILTYVFTFM